MAADTGQLDLPEVRLALGVEPRDLVGGSRVPQCVELEVEHPGLTGQASSGWPGDGNEQFPRMTRHSSCRYVLTYGPKTTSPVKIRLTDPTRWFVPRRFEVAFPTETQVNLGAPLSDRVRRPVLFPGAAYPVTASCTGLRGRAVRNGQPMRWTRVEARFAGDVVGLAHGDDRGDFLLIISLPSNHVGAIPDPVPVSFRLFGPDTAPDPNSPSLLAGDPLWDLPIEKLMLPGTPDPAGEGTSLPDGYRSTADLSVDIPLGRFSSFGVAPFDFV